MLHRISERALRPSWRRALQFCTSSDLSRHAMRWSRPARASRTLATDMVPLEFTHSQALTIGVELELQLVNTSDFNLAPDADDLLRRAASDPHVGELKPEITQSM